MNPAQASALHGNTGRLSHNRLAAILICALGTLILVSCGPSLKSINLMKTSSQQLDSGLGMQTMAEELLPAATTKDVKPYEFLVDFDLQLTPTLISGKTDLALIIGPSSYPYQLFLNGRKLHSFGTKEDANRTRLFSTIMVQLDPLLLREQNTIMVQAYIRSERNPLPDLAIASSQQASSYVYWRNFFMTQLVTGGFVIGLLLLVYFMFMYIAGKGRNSVYFWFALFCGSFALAYVNIVFNHLAASDTLLTKFSRTGFFLCVSFFTFFVMETTGLLHRRRIIKQFMLGLVAIASLLIWLQPDFNSANSMFHITMQFIITPNLLFCIALIVASTIRRGIKKNLVLIIGFTGVIITSLYDMGFETGQLMPYAWMLVYGYLWLVLCIFFELAIKQELVFRTSQEQAEAINKQNSILQNVFGLLDQESSQLTTSAEEIAVSAREVSVTGNQQAAAVREMVATMEDAGSLLNQIARESDNVNEATEATLSKATEGADSVRNALKKLEAVINHTAEAINLINSFNEELTTITDIVRLIEGIATQIRIIAFNASLEAVAAGDAGRNFRIVAEEVKRLADSTMSSVKNIKTKVNSLIAFSGKVVSVSREGYSSLEQSWDIASGMGDAFSGIVESAEASAGATQKIHNSINEENMAFSQILQALKEISSGVNSFVESANYTSETTKKLHGIAGQLHELIIKYSSNKPAENAS